jgi:tetratricopeptide (TPR) repeat protein
MRSVALLILTVISLEAYAQADRKFVRKGNENYNDGSFQQAEVEYRKALEKDPLSYRADYNLGNALYRQKQYDAAAARYSGLAEKEHDRQKLSQYYYNLGNTMYENKKYQESVVAYKNSLRNNPADMDAKHNLQLALKMLNEQQQQQKKNDQKNKDNKQKDQDQQKQNQQKNQQDQNQKNNQQDQNQQKEQPEQANQLSQQQQVKKGQISPQDADRILQALENEEKEVMKKVQERKERVQKVQVEKNW